MSLWSSVAKFVGGAASAAGNVLSAVPGLNVVGSALSQGGNFLTGQSAAYEQNKQNVANRQLSWDLQKDAQKYNSLEAMRSWQRGEKSAEISRQFNSSEAEKVREFELAMWKRANEYNSPANQLKLLQQAGYNPNIFQSSVSSADGSLSSPLASSSPASSSPASSPLSSSSVLPNPAMVDAQVRLANAQTEKLQSETKTEYENQKWIDTLAQGQADINNTQVFLNITDQHYKEVLAKKCFSEIYKNTFEIENLNATTENLHASTRLLDEKAVREAFENENAVKKLAKYFEQIDSEIKKNNAQITLFNSQANSYDALARYYLQQASNAVIEGGKLGLQYDFDSKTQQARVNLVLQQYDKGKLDIDYGNFNFEYDKQFRRSNELFRYGADALGAFGQTLSTSVLTYGVLKGTKVPKTRQLKNIPGTSVPNIGPTYYVPE